jgi:hypothetical protein
MIKQLTVFLENSEGRLAALCKSLGDAGVNMHALTLSDTADYGLVRIICDDPDHALEVLNEEGYRALVTKVSAIEVGDQPGGLASLLSTLNDLNLNIEYGYCFGVAGGHAVDVFKMKDAGDAVRASAAIEKAGFRILTQDDLIKALQ